MTTYNTRNPVPSADARDRYDNSQVFDELMNGPAPSTPDRLGVLRQSWAGMDQAFGEAQVERDDLFNIDQSARDSAFQSFLDGSGWSSLGDYAAGLSIVSHSQTVDYQGQPYQLKSSVPASITSPYVTTGNWAVEGSNFKLVGDNSLRQDLSDPLKGASLIGDAVRRVPDIKSLLLTSRRTTQAISVASYHTAGAMGGGRLRYWDAAMSKTKHNGGTVIDPDKAFPADWDVVASVEAWFAPAKAGVGCWVMQDNGGVFLPTEFGASPTINNNQPAYWACCTAGGDGATIIFTPTTGSYRMHWFYGFDNQHVVAWGAKIDLFKLSPTTGPAVLAASGNYARYSGVWLNCLETNLPNVRTTFEDRHDSHWYKCKITGFRGGGDGWGMYLKRAYNITLDQCYYENNSQNDIAILEGTYNVNIISPSGAALNINFEPNNGALAIRNVKITNATISKLLVQENDGDNESANSILVENCEVQELFYDGAGVTFVNSAIRSLKPWYDGLGRAAGGVLKLNGAIGLGPNLLRDPALVSTSFNIAGSSWTQYTGNIPIANCYSRVRTTYGRAFRMNPTNVSGTNSILSEAFPVVAGGMYMLKALMGIVRPASGSAIPLVMAVRWLNAGGTEIGNTVSTAARVVAGLSSVPRIYSASVQAPVGAVTAQVIVGSTVASASTSSTDWYHVGLHRVYAGSRGDSFQDPDALYLATNGPLAGVGATPTASSYSNYEVGDRIRSVSPAAAGYESFICTAAGTPGTWKGVGLIQS